MESSSDESSSRQVLPIDLAPARVLTALREQWADLKRNPRTLDKFRATLEQQRLVQTVARLRRDHYTDLL